MQSGELQEEIIPKTFIEAFNLITIYIYKKNFMSIVCMMAIVDLIIIIIIIIIMMMMMMMMMMIIIIIIKALLRYIHRMALHPGKLS